MENSTEKLSSSASSLDERDLILSMKKLDLIKELGDKQAHFQRLQQHLNQNTDLVSRENQVLREFRKELDLLVQERMSHIEELRLIHADINIMETTIKQAEEERSRALQESKRLLKDYQPIKEQINKIREILHLDKLPENDEDETALMTMQILAQQANEGDLSTSNRSLDQPNPHETHHPLIAPFLHQTQSSNNIAPVLPATSTTTTQSTTPAAALQMPKVVPGLTANVDRTSFRQQPPPMKTCQSCQQQIHRNAPICPICKAKSRSRNPKKPKRRHTDLNP